MSADSIPLANMPLSTDMDPELLGVTSTSSGESSINSNQLQVMAQGHQDPNSLIFRVNGNFPTEKRTIHYRRLEWKKTCQENRCHPKPKIKFLKIERR